MISHGSWYAYAVNHISGRCSGRLRRHGMGGFAKGQKKNYVIYTSYPLAVAIAVLHVAAPGLFLQKT
jgi:hypothetical protein